MPSEEAVDPLLSDLSPRCCIGCDFSLQDWPQRAQCPQCGLRERADVVTLRGWNSSVPRLTRVSEWLVNLLLGSLLIGMGAGAVTQPQGSAGWLLIGIGLLVTAGPVLRRARYRWWNGAGDPPLRCHLSPRGFALGMGTQGSEWRMWEPNWQAKIQGPNHRRACWLIVKPRVGFLAMGNTEPVLKFDFNATREQLEALQLHITHWIEGERVGHGFEVLPARAGEP